MKHILRFSAILAVAAFATTAFAAKPVSTCATIQGGTITDSAGHTITLGYDQWGYNYEARMFNGWYDNYSRPAEPATTGDRLMMKWNDAWLSNQDCSGDNKLDRHLGFDSYIGSGAWLTNHASGSYESDTAYHWDVADNWVIAVNDGAYPHDYVFAMTSLSDGTFTGTGGYPAGGPYTFDEVVINGQITGDTITFTAAYYQGGVPTGYVWNANGTIALGGTMSGTGDAGVYEWHTTAGTATKVMDMCEWSDFVKIVAAPADATLDGGYWYAADDTEIGPEIWGEFAIIQEISSDPCGEYGDFNYMSPLRKGLGNW